jgi:hypothetical protein
VVGAKEIGASGSPDAGPGRDRRGRPVATLVDLGVQRHGRGRRLLQKPPADKAEPAVAKPKLPPHPSQMAERGIPASPWFEHPIALARLCLTNRGLPAPGWSLANAAYRGDAG